MCAHEAAFRWARAQAVGGGSIGTHCVEARKPSSSPCAKGLAVVFVNASVRRHQHVLHSSLACSALSVSLRRLAHVCRVWPDILRRTTSSTTIEEWHMHRYGNICVLMPPLVGIPLLA